MKFMGFNMAGVETKSTVKDAKWYFDNQVLDDEELEIERDLVAGIYVQTSNLEAVKEEFKQAAENYRRKKPVTVRFDENDILSLKRLATKAGIPYQTLVSSIIHRYVTGQLKGDV